ncbi:hypothetical protein F2Q69_00057956 [Brassica cretica]|uniref:Exonuclease domain-containing protein n=1 Tax=Brassica cretica TaxID=69181 RepID=A0A8S9N1A8_BRACR|nr:hypothetical protein F2Q69_00057956 [Brassica cretica]
MTVTHDEYPFDFMIPYNPKDWVLTGILENPPYSPVPFRPKVPFDLSKTDMIAICCKKVFCANKTEAAVRVAAVNRNLKVVFDKLVEPDQPVINYRTSITGLDCFTLVQRNATPLADIQVVFPNILHNLLSLFLFFFVLARQSLSSVFPQDKLLGLFHMQTIMVGHLLNSDLKALKMDHARVIDTSLVFNYDLSGGGGGIEKLPRPSLDHLCKSVLGCEIKKSPGRCVHKAVATMKLVLAILKRGPHTSVPLPDELASYTEAWRTHLCATT